MARIRSIKPEYWTSEQVTDCDPLARLLFIGMWTFADDNGIHPASPKRLKMEVLPADDISVKEVGEKVGQLILAKLVRVYEVHGERYWQITGWQHQRIDQPTYRHPLPDGSLPRNVRRAFNEDSSNGSTNDHGTFDDRSDRERRGEERRGEEEAIPLRESGDSDLLGQPVKAKKQPAVFKIVLTAYHETLPKCQKVSVLNPKREKRILAADKLAKKVAEEQGWGYSPADFWPAFFQQCAEDKWLRGEVPNPNNPNWKQNLDVLLAEDRFAQIMDRAIAEMQEES